MKKLLIIVSLVGAGFGMVACDRTALNMDAPLGVSKTSTIKKGEPIDFNFNSDASEDRISWSVKPERNVRISAAGKNARILFGEAGKYTVTATDQETSARTVVSVDSSTYVPRDTLNTSDTLTASVPQDTIKTTPPKPKPPVPADTVKTTPLDTVGTHNVYAALAGDHFTFTPSVVDTLSVAGLAFRIESARSYNCLNSYLVLNGFFVNPATKVASMNLNKVTQPGARYCQNGSKKVSANTFLYPLEEGENKIEVAINGHVYSGKVVRRNKTFTIDWPDTNEISFSKLIINK